MEGIEQLIKTYEQYLVVLKEKEEYQEAIKILNSSKIKSLFNSEIWKYKKIIKFYKKNNRDEFIDNLEQKCLKLLDNIGDINEVNNEKIDKLMEIVEQLALRYYKKINEESEIGNFFTNYDILEKIFDLHSKILISDYGKQKFKDKIDEDTKKKNEVLRKVKREKVLKGDAYEVLDENKKREIIKNTIIKRLQENNIFEGYFTVEQIEEKLNYIIKKIALFDSKRVMQESVRAFWSNDLYFLEINSLDWRNGEIELETTIIHELLHALSTNEVEQSGICKTKAKNQKYGNGLNEGITEYFAQLLCPTTMYYKRYKNTYIASSEWYAMELIAIKQLAIIFGEEALVKVYFENKDITDITENHELKEHLIELRENYDTIYKWDNKGCVGKQEIVFVESQEYFYENILKYEIENVKSLNEANILKEKLIKLNDLIVFNNRYKYANCYIYNYLFIRKYMELLGKNDKDEDYHKEYNNLYKELMHVESSLELSSKDVEQSSNEFKCIKTENGKKIYIQKCSEDMICGYKTYKYQYLSEEEYQKYLKIPEKENYKNYLIEKYEEYLDFEEYKLFIEYFKDDLDFEKYKAEKNNQTKKYQKFTTSEKYKEFMNEKLKQNLSRYYKEFIDENKEEKITDKKIRNYFRNKQESLGKILVGNIDFEKIDESEEYRKFLVENIFSEIKVGESILNYRGYIGDIKSNPNSIKLSEGLQKFYKAKESGYVGVKYNGCNIYIRKIRTNEYMIQYENGINRTIKSMMDWDEFLNDENYRESWLSYISYENIVESEIIGVITVDREKEIKTNNITKSVSIEK